MEVKFQFAIGDSVTINANGLVGTIKQLWMDEHDLQRYLVEYVNANNSILTEWRTAEEIKLFAQD